MVSVKRITATATHYLHTLPGVESIAAQEVRSRLPSAQVVTTIRVPKRNGLTLLKLEGGTADELTNIRTAEDVFAVVAHLEAVPWGREGLAAVYEGMLKAHLSQETLVATGHRKGRGREALRFRVISRLSGPPQPYERHDLANSVAAALRHRSKGKWKRVETEEDVEVWANLMGRTFVCGIRLTGAGMRHRDYQDIHLPAALRPSLAAAMAWLTSPQADDVFLDPMCGTGTLLIERALLGRHRLLLGGDIEWEAIAASRINIGRKHKPRQLFQWHAGRLPLEAATVNKVACNLPFGRKVQVPGGLAPFYQRAVAEMARVLVSGGVAVLLTSEQRLLTEALAACPLAVERLYPVDVLGQHAQINVLRRAHE